MINQSSADGMGAEREIYITDYNLKSLRNKFSYEEHQICQNEAENFTSEDSAGIKMYEEKN